MTWVGCTTVVWFCSSGKVTTPVEKHGCTTEACGYVGAKRKNETNMTHELSNYKQKLNKKNALNLALLTTWQVREWEQFPVKSLVIINNQSDYE